MAGSRLYIVLLTLLRELELCKQTSSLSGVAGHGEKQLNYSFNPQLPNEHIFTRKIGAVYGYYFLRETIYKNKGTLCF